VKLILWDFYEDLSLSFILVLLVPIAIACSAGAIPGIIEHRRRRRLEEALPEILEAMSNSVGAGLGIEQALHEVSSTRRDETGSLMAQAMKRAKATTFNAALAEYALLTRSVMIQRVMNLLSAAIEQNAPLQEVTNSMSVEYDRLNKLVNMREKEMTGQSFLLIMLMCLLLPVIMGFMFGAFATGAGGAYFGNIHGWMITFHILASAVCVGVSGRMLGRMKQALWWAPFWGALSSLAYIETFAGVLAGLG